MKVRYFGIYEKGFVMPEGKQVDILYGDDSANIFYNGKNIHIGADGLRVRIMKAKNKKDVAVLACGNYGARLFV